jgi:hypothetical protein
MYWQNIAHMAMTYIPENGWGERIRTKIIILKLQILFNLA